MADAHAIDQIADDPPHQSERDPRTRAMQLE